MGGLVVRVAAAGTSLATAVVRITHGGKLWTGATIRWHDQDLAVSRNGPGRSGKAGSKLLVVGDGSTVYSGTVAAALIARETGVKEGQAIRVLPFGYVAHDEAANPTAPLRTAVTVSAAGTVREISVTWGTSASAWTYTVAYQRLGATPAPVAPANARPLRDRSHAHKSPTTPRSGG